jgi:tyrosyl-tRNA synthetase
VLARHVTALVHGEAATLEADAISRALFSGDLEALTEVQLDQACRTMPTTTLAREEVDRLPVVDLLARVGLAGSRREARDLLSAGAIAVNGRRVSGVGAVLTRDTLRFGRFVILRKGKKSYHAVTLA